MTDYKSGPNTQMLFNVGKRLSLQFLPAVVVPMCATCVVELPPRLRADCLFLIHILLCRRRLGFLAACPRNNALLRNAVFPTGRLLSARLHTDSTLGNSVCCQSDRLTLAPDSTDGSSRHDSIT